MSDNNDNNSADLIADAIRFASDSKYLSTSEFYRDQHSPRYKSDPVYRQECDAKLARSATHFSHVRVIDSSGGIRTAAATRNADGTIDSGITGPDAPSGKTPSADATVNGLPLIKTLPGGTVQVQMSSGSTATAKADAQKEKDAHEARLRRKQGISSLPGKK